MEKQESQALALLDIVDMLLSKGERDAALNVIRVALREQQSHE